MKKKNILVIVFICLVLAGLGTGGFFVIQGQMNQKIYKEKMLEGQKYLAQMKYEQAEAAFEFALEKNPRDEEAYIGLYRVLSAQGKYRQAVHILEKGYDRTKSERILELLNAYKEKNAGVSIDEEGNASKEDLEELSQETAMNVSLFQKLKTYHYEQYKKDFGTCISNEKNGDSLEIIHKKLDAVFAYENKRGEEKAIDSQKNLPYDTAAPSSVRLQEVSFMFRGFKTGISFSRLKTIVGSHVELAYNEEQKTFTDSFTYQDCKVEIACDEEGNIVNASAWNKILLPAVSQEEKGNIQGRIINAVTGEGLDRASVKFISQDSGEEIDVQTDRYGLYEAEIPPGQYKMEVSKEGFIQEEKEIEIEEEESQVEAETPLSPVLADGEIRIVLTWGAVPHDLDSYLGNLDGRAQIYFGNKVMEEGGQIIAELDIDETSGYGPETITIYKNGNYRYWIHDFRHEGRLGGSEATVKIYMPNQAPVEIRVPEGVGDLWNVCEFRDGELKIINELEPEHSDRSGYK